MQRPLARIAICLAALAGAGLTPTNARADGSGLGIFPTRVNLGPGRIADAITVTNNDATPTVMEVHAFAWTRDGNRDITEPTTELLASPPIFKVAPGSTQVIRVGLRAPIAPDLERAYRITIKQVVAPHSGLAFASQFSLPVFVAPAASAQRSLRWSLRRGASGTPQLAVSNDGIKHEQLVALTLKRDDKIVFDKTVAEYLMPHQTIAIDLPRGTSLDAPLSVDATTDTTPVHAVAAP